MLFLRLFFESFRFAVNALKENVLRTVLSLLGVTVGIFAIIAIFTLVDALNNSIQSSLAVFGNNVMYVGKWPFAFNEPNYPWWKYYRRPNPNVKEYKFIQENAKWVKHVAIFEDKRGKTIQYKNSSFEDGQILGASFEYNKINTLNIEKGRYFTSSEMQKGVQNAIIGHSIAEELFSREDPIGKTIKTQGQKFKVIGVFEKQGESLLNTPSNDELIMIPYSALVKMYASKGNYISPQLIVKGFEEDEGMEEIQGELRGLLRRVRGIRPKEEDNFALNKTDAIADFIGTVTGSLKIAGGVIGMFSILVGGFSIANIMFVSVKERTSQIGIQKALGAKNYFILLQFLCEAMFLSFFGGIMGLLLVSLLSFFSTEAFEISLNFQNLIVGLFISAAVGIISGIAPAISASRMDPVEAMRAS
ncbi:ABC transporter permease [Flammeovirga pacifica]|uniref:ABC transporter n=1 Tax=Flammeovirga pacifica TaxID=915059 RepID=A0A1S1Z1S4_FLAPC|nr:ABC transporter permease [Flammeovirga pacifica]OHX67192.1 ABC transporter [Flammeovirga pacifica]